MVRIRKMEPKDINQVYAMGKKTSWFAVSEETLFEEKKQLKRWAKNELDTLLVADEDGEIVGFILSQFHQPTDKATIEDIVVKEAYRKKGIGTKLLKECLRRLKKNGARYICALTKTNNKVAINFFLKHGFQKGYNFTWLEKT